jgi:hypothetical protein
MSSLTVHVVDNVGNSWSDKKVFVHFNNSTHLEDYTGSDGSVTFEDCPDWVVATIMVDGADDVDVNLDTGHEDATLYVD